MRITWIDGMPVEVKSCGGCPFFSFEKDGTLADCNYPTSKVKPPYQSYPWDEKDVCPGCPLKVKEE